MGKSGEFRFKLYNSMMPFLEEFDNEGYPARRSFQFDTAIVLQDYSNGVRGPVSVNASP